MAKDLYEVAREINESLKPKDSPKIGQTWIFEGKEVTITSGYFLDPVYHRVSNCFTFKFKNGKTGSSYDNDRKIFHPKSK